MRRDFLFSAGLLLIAGLSTGCSGSGSGSVEAEERVAAVSDKLTPEESALIASGEAEAGSTSHPAALETH